MRPSRPGASTIPGSACLHTAGERDLPTSPGASANRPPAWYDLRGFICGFGEALLACDLVVARSGGSIFEVAAAGRPAILVPYPHAAADHQAENARWMERAGAAIVIDDAEVTRRAPAPARSPRCSPTRGA